MGRDRGRGHDQHAVEQLVAVAFPLLGDGVEVGVGQEGTVVRAVVVVVMVASLPGFRGFYPVRPTAALLEAEAGRGDLAPGAGVSARARCTVP